MSSYFQPKEHVKYRIMNVDYGTFVQRRNADDDLAIRPKKQDALQHWVFVKIQETPPLYEIRDPDPNETTMLYGQLSPSPGLKASDGTSPQAEKNWSFVTDHLSGNRTYIVSNSQGRKPCMMYLDEGGALSIEQLKKSVSQLRTEIKGEGYQWEITEVNPSSLPEGSNQNYRIRTLVGDALQLDAAHKITLDKQDRRGNHRTWAIENIGNGSCTIFNVEAKLFLATKDKGSLDWEPSLSDKPDIWIIQPTSDFTFSIGVERNILVNTKPTLQSLSLALDRGNAILKAKKPAHNQIWLIEPEDAAINVPDDHNQGDGGKEVAPGLLSGDYKLRNTDGRKFYVSVTRNPSNNTFDIASDGEQRANKFKVEVKGEGVVIYCLLNRLKVYLVATAGKATGQVNNEFVWKITQGGSAKQYYITDSTNKVLTSPTDIGVAFTLAAQGQANQQWEFVL
ncbi:hypothetical protein GALMADRAFT_237675 [Galerina marginata CBS 339.88]|uniref:Uncharacterized protein n=1 Tax=Galerina marginata (strain CBS 339.88) TaxID=685588 RepID=A0A067TTV0_GALM3|nr:hypothetical protein GALMADRAFT_237675 [Galerina marginata CBS 339.88]